MTRHFHVIGMKHSGSTLCFRLIQYLCRANGYVVPSLDNDTSESDSDSDSVCGTPVAHVGKSHQAPVTSSLSAIRIQYILTVRDVRDAAISNFFRFQFSKDHHLAKDIVNLYGTRPFEKSMMENIRLYQCGLLYMPVIFCYEEYQHDALRSLRLLQQLLFHHPLHDDELCIVLDNVNLLNTPPLVKNLRVFYEEQNKGKQVPLLMDDHNTSNGAVKKYETFMSCRQHALILENRIIKCWLKENGYPIDFIAERTHDSVASHSRFTKRSCTLL